MTTYAIGIGHNGGPAWEEDLRKPAQKLSAEEEKRFARIAHDAAVLLAVWFRMPRKRLMGKRQGDYPLFVRRALFHYLRGLNCPVKLMAQIFDLERSQPGADSEAMERWTARNPELEVGMDNLTSGLDGFLAVKPAAFMVACASEIEADRACVRAARRAKEAADLLDRPAAPKRKYSKEVERLVAQGQKRRQDEAREKIIAVHMAVIRAGASEGATRDQKREALRAAKDLDAVVRKRPRRKVARP